MISTPSRIRPRTRYAYQRGLGFGFAFVGGATYEREVFFARCRDFGIAPTMLPGDEQQGVLGGRLDGGPGVGARPELPRGPQVRLVVPVRGRRVAGLSGGEHGERPVEVGEIHYHPPRGDHHGIEPQPGVESTLQDGLLVPAQLVLGRDEEVADPRQAGERVREPDPVQRAPPPLRSSLPNLPESSAAAPSNPAART